MLILHSRVCSMKTLHRFRRRSLRVYVLRLPLPRFSTRLSVCNNPPFFFFLIIKERLFSCLNEGVCFRGFWRLLQFEWFCVRFLGVGLVCRRFSPRPLRGRLPALILPSSLPPSLPLSLADASLADYVQTCPGRNAPTFLMHFYVQAIWQWRAPSFCSINISFPIWMQIWGQLAPEYKWTGRLSPWKNNGGPPPTPPRADMICVRSGQIWWNAIRSYWESLSL